MAVGQKIKRTQAVDIYKPHPRDMFQTPHYATDLLVKFIPAHINRIWECASGQGKIANRLSQWGYNVLATDILYQHNFLLDSFPISLPESSFPSLGIITNPPFSLKRKFFEKCIEFGFPFALLIPADYSGWIIEGIRKYGCEKIIPTRRIDYITPTGLSGETGHTSNFHSMWLTYKFNLGNTETFVELTNEMKKNI